MMENKLIIKEIKGKKYVELKSLNRRLKEEEEFANQLIGHGWLFIDLIVETSYNQANSDKGEK